MCVERRAFPTFCGIMITRCPELGGEFSLNRAVLRWFLVWKEQCRPPNQRHNIDKVFRGCWNKEKGTNVYNVNSLSVRGGERWFICVKAGSSLRRGLITLGCSSQAVCRETRGAGLWFALRRPCGFRRGSGSCGRRSDLGSRRAPSFCWILPREPFAIVVGFSLL